MQGIYYIENVENLRRYYGSSFNVKKRLLQHKSDLIKGKHHNTYLQRCYNKYGDIFRYVILEECKFTTTKDLLDYEQKFIDKNINGYNLAPAGGGNILGTHPEKDQIRKQILRSHKENLETMSSEKRKEKFGRPDSKNGNWKEGVSIKICPRCKINYMGYYAKTCNKCRNRTEKNNPFYGKHHSEETKSILKEKMSGDNSWIKGIDPSKLPYTKHYEITYPSGEKKVVAGLKAIAIEFSVSIPNIYGIINRCKKGNVPQKGKFAHHKITEIILKD